MKAKLYIKALFFLLALIVSQACMKEDYEPEQQLDGELMLRVEMKDAEPMRATEPGQDLFNENKVEKLKLLFYQDATLIWSVDLNETNLNSAQNYIIDVPQSVYPKFDGTKPNNIYVIANPEEGMTAPNAEAELPQLLVSKSIADPAPADFLILGSTTKTIDMSNNESKNLGNVELKRLAAKLRINKPVLNISGYELLGVEKAKLRNYVDKAHLIEESLPAAATHQAYGYRELNEGGNTTHFYSYFNSWTADDMAHAPEFMLWLRLKKTGEPDDAARNYYYRIPVNASDAKIKSNYLYNMTVSIEVLGSLTEEDPVTIHGNLQVLPWKVKDETYGLPATEFLVVAEKEAKMNNVNTYKIAYQSSKKPISINITTVRFKYVNANGQEVIKNIATNDPQYPSIGFNDTHITINSAIPINNIPKEIIFEVTNGVPGLKETVRVMQYPSQFITNTWGTASNLRPDGSLGTGLNNKAIYHITVLVPPGDMVLGFPPKQQTTFHDQEWVGGYWSGHYEYPVQWTDWTTSNDALTANMVSPSFELASQLGATARNPYDQKWEGTNYQKYYNLRGPALCNCATYWEKRVVNGETITLDDWRLPTEAEIRLVDQLQTDPQSAVKAIMTGKYYWDAYSGNNAYGPMLGFDGGNNPATPTSAHIRCVRDVKEDITTKEERAKR